MTRGGLRPNNKSDSNHLFKPKWRLGKTTAIRIPDIFKNSFLEVARYLDLKPKSEIKDINFVEVLEENNKLKIEICNLQNELRKFQQKLEIEEKLNQLDINNQVQNIEQNKYQIAVECFVEFVENQDLNIEELSKARKGSKKHQLWMIYQWLKSHE